MARFGAYCPGNPVDTKHAIETALGGRKLDVCYLGAPWYSDGHLNTFPAGVVGTIGGEGATTMLHHQPWNLQNQLGDPEWRVPRVMQRLNGGDLEPYLRQYARDIGASNRDVVYRLTCEFNGRYPQYNTSYENAALGLTAADFVGLHRRTADIVRAEGGPRVRIAWNPNFCFPPDNGPYDSQDPTPGYPGDGYVDVIGVDGYPWAGAGAAQIFGPIVGICRRLAPTKPLWIMETNGYGQEDEGVWAAKVMAYAEAEKLDGVIWFCDDDTHRPDKVPALGAALRTALARPYWQATPPPPSPAPALEPMGTDLAAYGRNIRALDARLRKAGY